MTVRVPAQYQGSQLSRKRQRQTDQAPERRPLCDCVRVPIGALDSRNHAHQLPGRNWCIFRRHGIAARDQMIRVESQHAMNEKPVEPRKQHNIPRMDLLETTGFDGQMIAGPEAGQHAVAEGSQLHLSGAAENLSGEGLLDVLPKLGTFRHEENSRNSGDVGLGSFAE